MHWWRSMEKKDKTTYIEKYKPEYFTYIVIIAIFAIVRFVPFSTGYANVDEALNDLAVGATASTLVAWMLDAADCNKKNKDFCKKQNLILNEYKSSVSDLRFFIARRCMFLTKTPMEERTFAQWLFMYTDISSYEGIDNPRQRLKEQYETLSKRIKYVYDALYVLKQQYFVLVSEDFVDTGDFKQHIDYQSNLCLDIFDYIANEDYSTANDIIKEMVKKHDDYFEKGYEEKYNGITVG